MKLNRQTVVFAVLVIAVVVSALSLVSVRQMNRLAFYDLLKLEGQRDDLSIEWRQLMAEFSTWRLAHSVEAEVRDQYQMEPPSSKRIQTIRLAAQANGQEGVTK